MHWSLIVALQTAPVLTDGTPFDPSATTVRVPLGIDRRCATDTATDEILVCGRRDDRYRLPLPVDRAPVERTRGEAPGGLAAITPYSRCGIFAGERQCGKREAADYGYGKGRDPVTIVTRLAEKLVDPDAE